MTTVAVMVLLAVAGSPPAFRNAIVVSTDVPHLTLTIKGDQGTNEVVGVDAGAAPRLKLLKAGDEVILTVRTDGARQVVTLIEPSVRGRKPAGKVKPRAAKASSSAAPARPPAPPPPAETTPKVSPAAASPRPPTDTVGPLQDPRRGAQQDPRDNPVRDPRVIPGLTVPPPNRPTASPSPSPSPTPTPMP